MPLYTVRRVHHDVEYANIEADSQREAERLLTLFADKIPADEWELDDFNSHSELEVVGPAKKGRR